jgi:hypothetical protein
VHNNLNFILNNERHKTTHFNIAILLSSYGMFAQQQTITGTVYTATDNVPLPGVSVTIKNTSKGTTTDFDGVFSIQASSSDVLEFSYIGFETQIITITDFNDLIIKLGYEFMYGKVEVRAKLPKSQGTWPAIWMLGSSFSSIGWPYCGEIDIMEQSGQDKSKVLGTCHWNGNGLYPSGDNYSPASYGTTQPVSNVDSDWHIYSVDWTINHIKIYIDGINYFSMNTVNTQPFNDPFFILLNVAMGGTLGGAIDPAFTEDVMEIDYIRVYQ